MTAKPGMRGYRPEIDGLRAIAIAAVALFHFQAPGFQGGFIGVDIFFVVSGFLITRNILAEIERDRFTLIGFYVRRIRRIVPSLIATSIRLVRLPLWLGLEEQQTKVIETAICVIDRLTNQSRHFP